MASSPAFTACGASSCSPSTPDRFADIEGSTDSEVLMHLALTEGLEDDPLAALGRALGRVEAAAERHGIDNSIQASIGVSDGERLWAVRYSTEGKSRTLFVSGGVHALRQLHPDNPRLAQMRDDDCVVVSEPFSDLPGAWVEIPESTVLIVHPDGEQEQRPFRPSRPA
jgi:predicted glutamine amidotransferase